MTDIARGLNNQGLTTVRGNQFTVNSLTHTIRQRAYLGEYRYADVVIPNGMPILISQELFDKAQDRLIQNKRQGGQRANGLNEDNAPRFWLTGKLYCGKCGSPMQGVSGTSKTKVKHYYYACSSARKRQCSMRYIKKDDIEYIVCYLLSSYLENSENLASLAVSVFEYYKKEYEDTRYIEGLKVEKKEAEKALNNLVKAIE